MRKLYDEFLSLIDGGAIYERTLKLSALEQHQTTPYHHIVADLVLDETDEHSLRQQTTP